MPKNKYAKTGYTFNNWRYTIGGNTYYVQDGGVVTISEAMLKVNGMDVVKFVAQWSKTEAAQAEKIGTLITDKKSASKYVVSSSKNKTVTYKKPTSKNITSVNIPNTITKNGVTYKVTQIDAKAFKDCKKLKKVKMGTNITKIGNEAFYGCIRLTSIEIGTYVTTIGSKALYGCSSLKSIELPRNTNKLGKQFVSKCKKLKTIYIRSSSITAKTLSDGACSGIGKKVVIKVQKAKVTYYRKTFRKKGLLKAVKVQAYKLLR